MLCVDGVVVCARCFDRANSDLSSFYVASAEANLVKAKALFEQGQLAGCERVA